VGASLEQFNEEEQKIRAHQGYAKKLFRTVKNILPKTAFRQNLVDAKTANVGAEITAQREQFTEHKRIETDRRKRVATKAESLRIPTGILNPQSDETNKGLDMMLAAMREKKQAALAESATLSNPKK
jgi:hypothetical protein